MGEYPFRLLPLVAATFPKGTASAVAGSFAALPKGVPLGELSSEARLRGCSSKGVHPPNTTYVQI